MTIRDLLEAGISIQGAFQIKRWSDEKEAYEIISEGSEFESSHWEMEDELDKEIIFIYAIPTEEGETAYTVFEVTKN